VGQIDITGCRIMRIDIDFIPGSHGNYLEFVLTKLLFPDELPNDPFNNLGASHKKFYNKKIFFANHYIFYNIPTCNDIISIRFDSDDLLSLMSISLQRAGNISIDDDQLHINTYNKLKNKFYKGLLVNMLDSYKFQLSNVDENNPDIPRHIVREFFKFGFKEPSINGFIEHLDKMKYSDDKNVHYFPYKAFYDIEKFLLEINKVGQFFNLTYQNFDLIPLHTEFLSKQPFKDIKKKTDNIIDAIKQGKNIEISNLTLFQESYINSQLENLYKVEMPFLQDHYFTTTKEILNYLN
jgi:hypothetical protein